MPKETRYRNPEWKVSDRHQRVKVDRLAAEGKKQPAPERSRREQPSEAIARALNPQEGGGES